MNEKIDDLRSTEEFFAPQARERYVLENVFWVPLSNRSVRHSSTSHALPEPRSETPTTNGKVSSLDATELGSLSNIQQRPTY
jgi:hypothetical protein